MKNIKFTIKNVDKQFAVPMRNVETGQHFIDQLIKYWNLTKAEMKLHVNNGIAINPNTVIIRDDSKLQIEIIKAALRITLKNRLIAFEVSLFEDFGSLKKYIRDEIFSLSNEVVVFLFSEGQSLPDDGHIYDIVLNPCISCQLMTTIKFRIESRQILKYIDINDNVKNIIAEIQKSEKKKIEFLKYGNLIMLPNDSINQYGIKNDTQIIDVCFEETQPEFLKLKVEHQNDNQTYKLKLSSTMENLVKQIIIDFFQNVANTKIKLKLNQIELPQTGLVKNVIGMKNEVIQIEKVSEGDKIIEIFLLKRGQTAIRTLKQIKISDKVSILNENFQEQIMNFYYNNKLLIKEKSFEIQGIKQNEVEIEFEEIEGQDENILFIDANTQQQTHKIVNVRKNLHEIICEQIGYDTDDYWVCIDYQQIMDTKKPLCEIQMKEKVIVYNSLDMILKVKYEGISQTIKVNKELCVIDLFQVFKEKFKIPDDKQYLIRYDGDKSIKDIVNFQLWAKKDCEFELYVKDNEQPKSELIQKQYIIKVEIPQLSTTIDFIVTVTDPIYIFLAKFLEFSNLPKNQPCELQNEGKTYSYTDSVQIQDLNLNLNFIFIIKEEMILQFKNKQTGDEHCEQLKFKEPFKQIKQSSQLFQQDECKFYYKSELIDIEKNLKDLEIFELSQIDYEIPKNQEQSRQHQELQQNTDNNNTIQINETQNQNQESNQDLDVNLQSNGLNQQNPIQEIPLEANDTNQNINILYKYQNQEFEISISNNTTVKLLKEKIIDFHNCGSDIDLRQEGSILNDENVITQFKSIFLVIPKSIKIIIKSKTKFYEQQFQVNAQIQELYDRMKNYYLFPFDLIFNEKILNPQLNFSQVGMKNNSVVIMKY